MSDFERTVPFIRRLENLSSGDRARFKRSAGKTLSEAGDALGLLYRVLPAGVAQRDEETYFLVATLFPLADAAQRGDFGAALRQAKERSGAKGMDRRVEILLDADMAQLPHRLRQTIRYLKASEVRVNWLGLLSDLLLWTHPKRMVQQRWARAYFAEHKANPETQIKPNPETVPA